VDTQQNSQQNGSEQLNVIFHGAFVFDQTTQPDQILALIPDIGHHSYRAGSWLAESELRGRTGADAVVYRLMGVTPGHERFDLDLNVVVKPQSPGKPVTLPYATLVFPRPQKITSLLVAEIPFNSFDHPEDLVESEDDRHQVIPRTSSDHPEEYVMDGACRHLATLQIFTYDFDFKNQNAVMLKADDGEGHFWEPVLTDGHINLHIFAAEDHFHQPSNADEDFNQCADLIGGLNLRLKTQTLPATRTFSQTSIPDGVKVDPRETESLARRTDRLARLGRVVLQENGDANVVWYGNDALDGDPEACSGPVR